LGQSRKGRRVAREVDTHRKGTWPKYRTMGRGGFPVGSETTEAELRELLKESADSAKDDYGPEAAVAWAEGYVFPPEFVRNVWSRS
jgi:hypothetical protein